MAEHGLLGSFEELVLLAVAHEGDLAYGMTVRRNIERRSGRSVTIGAVYATLERLRAKGYLESHTADGDDARRGRGRRYYRLLPDGAHALKRARDMHERMWDGIDLEPHLEGKA
jgi:PadR family transcriptional regulator PadR